MVEILTNNVATIPPSLHRKTRQPYIWLSDRTLFNTRVDELSEITPKHIEELGRALAPWCPPPREYVPPVVDNNSMLVGDKRYQAYARTALGGEASKLETLSDGRNWALYVATCKLGSHVHNGHITEAELTDRLMAACQANGYAQRAGQRQVVQTIKSGLRRSQNNSLPQLVNRAMARSIAGHPQNAFSRASSGP